MFDITTKFIGAVDLLALGMTAVDNILPDMRDLHTALSTFPGMPMHYQGTQKVHDWV